MIYNLPFVCQGNSCLIFTKALGLKPRRTFQAFAVSLKDLFLIPSLLENSQGVALLIRAFCSERK